MMPGYRNWGLQSSVSLCSQAVPRLIHEVQREDSLALSPWHLTQDLVTKTYKQKNKLIITNNITEEKCGDQFEMFPLLFPESLSW